MKRFLTVDTNQNVLKGNSINNTYTLNLNFN